MQKFISIQTIDTHKNHAGNKARADVFQIFSEDTFVPLYIPPKHFCFTKRRFMHLRRYIEPAEKQIMLFFSFFPIFSIKKNAFVFFQYPLEHVNKDKTLAMLRSSKAKHNLTLAAVIHDLDSLRIPDPGAVERETVNLKTFDYLIAHNAVMKNWLIHAGIAAEHICVLNLFDYLTDYVPLPAAVKTDVIAFAGNLNKSTFYTKLHEINGISFNIYGPNKDNTPFDSDAVHYRGQATPAEIVQRLQGSFGLVWDGGSLDTCEGEYGRYLKINTPHKTSLYIVAGLPVIVWKQSAIAPYITEKNIGITVDSLRDLPGILSSLTQQDYDSMRRNVLQEASDLASGKHLRTQTAYIMHSLEHSADSILS